MKRVFLCAISVTVLALFAGVFDARLPKVFSELSLKESYERTASKLRENGFEKVEYSDYEVWSKKRFFGELEVKIYRYNEAVSDGCRSIATSYSGMIDRKRFVNQRGVSP
ncbi:hypothetical protein JIN85_20410 [Luteolibacter pohnpeiensis]|uniref:Uncharacterized protein n=1 Tax=Luteolibacter pohnpeiensis TaxID=454153 RepID=A0A934SF82_9BACT|nr:hypothetical protein [Luteolibacter pohnpeiensis]MBK1884784.1 hypothetical protein [Luteolibacter pohnpeiensis]